MYHKISASFFDLDFHPVRLVEDAVYQPVAVAIQIQVVGNEVAFAVTTIGVDVPVAPRYPHVLVRSRW